MHRNRHLFVIIVFSDQKSSMFENADLCRTNWQKRYFDALSCYRTRFSFIWRTGKHSYHKLYINSVDDFPAVWNDGKMSAKFLRRSFPFNADHFCRFLFLKFYSNNYTLLQQKDGDHFRRMKLTPTNYISFEREFTRDSHSF